MQKSACEKAVVIMPSFYLPPVEYFACLLPFDELYIENDESYHRQSYRNRCCIYGPNGLQKLVLPVVHPGKENRNIKTVMPDPSLAWQQIHWRSITAAYNRSPFFEYYERDFFPFYHQPPKSLVEGNTQLLALCLRLLKMSVKVSFTGTFQKEVQDATDFRQYLLSKHTRMPERFPRYVQVFEPSHGFIPNLSVIDLLFNRGPEALNYLRSIAPLAEDYS